MSAVTITAIMPLPVRRPEPLPLQGHHREPPRRHVLPRAPLLQPGHQQVLLLQRGHQQEPLLQRDLLQERLLQHTAEGPGEAEAMEGVQEAVPGQAAVTAVVDTAAPQEAECQEAAAAEGDAR